MRTDGGIASGDNKTFIVATPERRHKGRDALKPRWLKDILDVAGEMVSETRAASSSRARAPEELKAFKRRMRDRSGAVIEGELEV